MGKDVLSKIRANDVYKALVRVLDEYGAQYEVEDRRPHPVFIISYVGLDKEFQFPSTPRPRVNLKRYTSDLRRFLQAMQYEALEIERQPAVPSKVGQVHVPMQKKLFSGDEKDMNDIALTVIDGEPRARDLDIAARLGFERERAIRQLIERNLAELKAFGPLATRRGKSRGQEFTEYWLTEEQALLIASRSDTENAADVRRMLIKVFVAWRRGQLQPQQPQALTTAEFLLQTAQALVDVERRQSAQDARITAIDVKVREIEGTHSVLSARPANAESITHIRKRINQKYGLSAETVDQVLRQSPYSPKPAGNVRNDHLDAEGSTYTVFWRKDVTAVFGRFVAECEHVVGEFYQHPYVSGRFKMVIR